MADIIQFNNHKENHFTFELVVEGIDVSAADVRCVIKWKPDVSVSLKCSHESGTKWNVKVPALQMLEKTSYNFVIEVVADGYFFEPYRGTLDVVGTPEVYVRTEEKGEKEKEVKETAPYLMNVMPPGSGDKTNPREKSIEQIAREMMAQHAAGQKAEASKKTLIKEVAKTVVESAEPTTPESKVDHEKDESVRKILNDISPSEKKTTKRFAITKGDVVKFSA